MVRELQQKIVELENKIQALDEERAIFSKQLNHLKKLSSQNSSTSVTQYSSSTEKIHLFENLFRGREDVYPKRWESAKTGKSGYSPVCGNEWKAGLCDKPRVKCSVCTNRSYLPVTDQVIQNHLSGICSHNSYPANFVIGVYPLLTDERCWFLAIDFDKANWQEDVKAFALVCKNNKVPYSVEISRSGKGAHIWIFFAQLVFAVEARKLGSLLLTQAMNHNPDMGFESYDRFFPNQDTMPKGGLGNLIALPLQKKAREQGNSVFVNDQLLAYEDQWAYLSTIKKLSLFELAHLINQAEKLNNILGVKMPVDEDNGKPWEMSPSRKENFLVEMGDLPKKINIVHGNQIFIEKKDLSAPLHNKIIRLAAFQNPEFYKAQAMRLPTFGKPRIISCAESYSEHIALPRGCMDELLLLLKKLKIKANIKYECFVGTPIESIKFLGQLTPEQEIVVEHLCKHDVGTLSATTAFGKTVIALYILAKRQVNTLIIVHRRQLMDQWLEKIAMFLQIDQKQIGKIGGGKRKPTGVVDVAIMQSLSKQQQVDDLVADYGQVIFDECHHLSAVSFESVAKACKAKYVLGLSATLTRKDGHHPIVYMQCGPVRYKVDPKKQALARPFEHHVVQRKTGFQLSVTESQDEQPTIQNVYAALIEDEDRNRVIIEDLKKLLKEQRSPLILTERKAHVTLLAEKISSFCNNVVVLQGGTGQTQRKQIMERLKNIPDSEERVLIATGRYLGEGFDDARLDTLQLVMPVSWKGTLAQYVGRLHRLHHAKTEVLIYDYVDEVPMLVRMSEKRVSGYKSLGYSISAGQK
ncbi:MAG: DEAD/DEAH box helicase [Methylococcales bacterium]|nr:DEAD/DEAH box helicase [Methylococcales bacterium]